MIIFQKIFEIKVFQHHVNIFLIDYFLIFNKFYNVNNMFI
jgi:hypothetical protein